jgi:TolA-binding protein
MARIDIGSASDSTVCAFCGRKVAEHKPKETGACRAGLESRRVAAEAAVKAEAEEQAKKKDAREQLDEIDDKISELEDKRKELLFEVAKEEAKEDDEVHEDCASKDDLKAAEDEAEAAAEALERFGGHRADCLSGALAGTQKLHPLCTCGWNDVATEIERW